MALCVHGTEAQACIENGTALPRSYEKVLKHCDTLFHRLPLDKKGEITNPKQKVPHYRRYRNTYKLYDKDCFFKWDNLHCHTQVFLAENVGALFESDSPVPFCTAFRLTSDVIMTAGHCATEASSKGAVMRLYGHPLEAIHIGARIELPPNGASLPDLDDFALYRLEKPRTTSTWNLQTFSRDVISSQAIFIVAPSLISDEAFDDNALVDNWLKQIRFSRAPSNQIWLASEMDHPLGAGPQREECLFHRNSTFSGMSGAPIIAATRPNEPGGVPTFRVIGIHLRNAFPLQDRTGGCGEHYPYNVGIKIPASVLDAIYPVQSDGQR